MSTVIFHWLLDFMYPCNVAIDISIRTCPIIFSKHCRGCNIHMIGRLHPPLSFGWNLRTIVRKHSPIKYDAYCMWIKWQVYFRCSYNMSHLDFIVYWVDVFVRAFVNICACVVPWWWTTLPMFYWRLDPKPFTGNIYRNGVPLCRDV